MCREAFGLLVLVCLWRQEEGAKPIRAAFIAVAVSVIWMSAVAAFATYATFLHLANSIFLFQSSSLRSMPLLYDTVPDCP